MDLFTHHSNNLKQNVNIIESVSSLSELAILGDQKESDIFDQFIEDKIIEEFVRTLKSTKDTNIVNTILHQISMLITNIGKNIVVLLSLPQLNEFIIYNYDLSNDETQDYYINFIKILSNKVTRENINLFFNQKYAQFPLLLYSQNFYNAKDNLTRTYTRHILLSILQIVENSQMEKVLLQYLQCYPFLQVLTNHISFFKDLLFKWSKDQDYYHEELKNMYYFFKDLYQIAHYLVDILDNLFLNIIIIPLLQTFQQKDENIKQQSTLIIKSFFNAEIIFSKRILISILILLFSPEIPKIQSIQLELNYLPTKDPELVNQCTRFFNIPQKESKDGERLSGLLQSITQTISYVSNNSIFVKEIPKQELYEALQSLGYIQKLNQAILFKENILFQDEHTNNFLNEEHYQSVLILLETIVTQNTLSLISESQKQIFIINLLNIMYEEQYNILNTLNNCQKSILIINQLLEVQDQNFLIQYIRFKLLRQMEQHIQSYTIEYYRYFSQILQSLQNKNIEIYNKIPVTHQIIKFLLLLDLSFQKQWLKNPFSQTKNPNIYKELSFNDGLIKLCHLEIITQNLNFYLDQWKIIPQEQKQTIIFINLIDDEKLELVFQDENEAEIFKLEVYQRQQDSEQHAISQIILQLQQLYF
ncbi:unnamed protein product [Paramecium pentaurelia]|uniref:FPL domain-containing protein n=1 Tax=Paramecium pentaurelia TaxID=43138 RepID=A0A8S1X412_9CILI|nr:unnamed protein product [Paramecium pentaurelia]